MKFTFLIAQFGKKAMSNRPHIELLHQWQAKGVDVTVLTLVNAQESAGWDTVDNIPVLRLPVRRIGLERIREEISDWVFHYRYFLNLIPAYTRALRQIDSDFVHVESGFPHGAAVALGSSNIPFSITLQGADIMSIPEYDYGYGRFSRIRRLLKQTFNRCALVRGDSIQIRDLAIELGCDPTKAVAVPYNITQEHFIDPTTDLNALRRSARDTIIDRHGLTDAGPIILSLGRLHPFKGVEYLVRSIPQVLATHPTAHFIIAGPSRNTTQFGDYQTYLASLVNHSHLTNVHFIGSVDHSDTRTYYAASDVVVVPSIAEAFNRVVVEAAAIGTPSVVTETTGVADYARPYNAAFIVPSENADAIANALLELFSHQHRYSNYSLNAQQFAQQFRPSVIADTLLDYYTNALLKIGKQD